MTSTDSAVDTIDTIPAAEFESELDAELDAAADRAQRLTAAGAAWGERIDADRTASRFTARVRGVGEGAVATRISAGAHEFVVDEPAALAGDDSGPSPVEYALGALISCQIVVFRLYAEVLGIPFDDISITAEGDLDAARLFGKDHTVRAGLSDVRLAVEIAGSETLDRYQELLATVEDRCPVLDIFANPTPVSATLTKS
ncbi:MAG TPA: OsmC family protein [Microbacterium sp.]|nr:OsmC family protein [Microbacterium sp.]